MKTSYIIGALVVVVVVFVGLAIAGSGVGDNEASDDQIEKQASSSHVGHDHQQGTSSEDSESSQASEGGSEPQEEGGQEQNSEVGVASEPETQPSADGGADAEVGVEAQAGPAAVITYTANGYEPANVTISAGETVRFENESDNEFWPASDIHPTHTQYAGTSRSEHCDGGGNNAFDACEGLAPGVSYSFTFEKAGTWQYHDHLSPAAGGTITVQ